MTEIRNHTARGREFSVRTAHTSELDASELEAARSLLYRAFADEDFSADDWEHSLGGMHVLATHEGALVGHAAVVQRRLLHQGKALRTGYVEGVAVHPEWQRHGIGGRLLDEVERIVTRAYEVGALGSTDAGGPLYRSRGWRTWEGTARALTPEGVLATQDAVDYLYVLPVPGQELDFQGDLICDYRLGDLW